jgi:hypothetical protein
VVVHVPGLSGTPEGIETIALVSKAAELAAVALAFPLALPRHPPSDPPTSPPQAASDLTPPRWGHEGTPDPVGSG